MTESIKKAKESLSDLYRVKANRMGRAASMRGTLRGDVYNRIGDVQDAYITLGLCIMKLETLSATWRVIFHNDLAELETLTREGLRRISLINENLIKNGEALQTHLSALIENRNTVDQKFQLAAEHITQAFAEIKEEMTTSLQGQSGQPVIDAAIAFQQCLDLVKMQQKIDAELTFVIDWRAKQAIADVEAIISQMP